MYVITKYKVFEAAHRIPNHVDPLTGGPGKCSALHGHSYLIEVGLKNRSLSQEGFVLDYAWVSVFFDWLINGNRPEQLQNILPAHERWDHNYLNDHPDFAHFPPTAENMSMIACQKLKEFLIGLKILRGDSLPELNTIEISFVTVRETSTSSAIYFPGQM